MWEIKNEKIQIDLIYFIEDGTVLEYGTHDSLISQKNGYYEMFNDSNLEAYV